MTAARACSSLALALAFAAAPGSQMLNITACEKCTGRGVNQDSVFCRSGKAVVTVFNESEPEVVVDSATAEAFCW